MQRNDLPDLRHRINTRYLAEESGAVDRLAKSLTRYDPAAVSAAATRLVKAMRAGQAQPPLIEAFLHEYRLDSAEGVVLMSIAEALLRIPDSKTQDLLLRDKLATNLWEEPSRHGHSLLVSLSSHALQLAGVIEQQMQQPGKIYERLLSRLGAPLIRTAIKQAMQLLAYQFVIAEDIVKALRRTDDRYRYSFDMLGESALTAADAERYFQTYLDAIHILADQALHDDIYQNPGISIKLTALYPRFEPLHHRAAEQQLSAKLLILARQARAARISLTIDAEESERLDMTLNLFQTLLTHSEIRGWHGLGLAVQAYQKRAYAVIEWLAALAENTQSRIPLRLVKGAYWDSEIKRTQENGLDDYPVFTHKSATDISYLACAEHILNRADLFYPQFATHNAHTVCAIRHLAGNLEFEFQRLYGMGEGLYAQLLEPKRAPPHCRVYAPVGNYQELLPYLIRRLLENGANTSFINQLADSGIATETLTRDPLAIYAVSAAHVPAVERPAHLFGEQRLNSSGVNLADPLILKTLHQDLLALKKRPWQAAPVIDGKFGTGLRRDCFNPANRTQKLGEVTESDADGVLSAIQSASAAFDTWRLSAVKTRAEALQKTAELLEIHRTELVSLLQREGGRTLRDALSEVREAVDYCRYYADLAMETLDQPTLLPGPTGEQNMLRQYGRGVFACISPWNFPVAIFIGQISAALVSGNTVIAKPAQQTALSAMFCIRLLHQAGIPEQVLHFLPGEGAAIGEILLSDPNIAGVAFTGSTATARKINRQLADNPVIVPFIAETGGQNVMIADSSAHCEQLVQDAMQSAFNSAGQRCSALRVLYLQEDIADKVIALLAGAMQQLVIGDPLDYATDIGPVIDTQAVARLGSHIARMRVQARLISQLSVPPACVLGSYFPPTLIELTSLDQLDEEVFGPVLHVIRFRGGELAQVIDAINRCGYGLTLGIHSRIEQTVDAIKNGAKVGNVYVNRNMIGAVVGVQPFGGMGLSGTGPKAGGPHYLARFCVEQTVTLNTAALGGNVGLLSRQLY